MVITVLLAEKAVLNLQKKVKIKIAEKSRKTYNFEAHEVKVHKFDLDRNFFV